MSILWATVNGWWVLSVVFDTQGLGEVLFWSEFFVFRSSGLSSYLMVLGWCGAAFAAQQEYLIPHPSTVLLNGEPLNRQGRTSAPVDVVYN